MKKQVLVRAVAVGALSMAGLTATAGNAVYAQGTGATAVVRDAAGQVVGTAMFAEGAGGVRITMQARNLPPGRHGIHLHAVGLCEPPAFTSAGGHFNPTNRQHGLNNPQGPHAGDLPELVVAANGTATYDATNPMVSLGTGLNSLFDPDGSALVIHANPDDQVTDPTGNTGDRIACGVLVRTTLPATGQPLPAARAGGLLGALLAGTGALALGAIRVARRGRR